LRSVGAGIIAFSGARRSPRRLWNWNTNPTSRRRYRASPASPHAARSSPWNRTRPPVGRSSPPSRWSKVDFPTPEAPMRATNSPGPILTLAPRSTRTTSGPDRYSFSSSSPTSSAGAPSSLIPEHVDRGQRARPLGRDDGRQERQDERGADDHEPVAQRELHRQVIDLVDVAGQPDHLVGVLGPDQDEAGRRAGGGARNADGHADGEEHQGDRTRGGADRLEDPDLLALLGDEQDEMADDRERGHQHDDRDDDEERELLELERREQTPVHLHPVAHPVAEAELSGNDAAHVLGVEGVVQLDLDSSDPGEPGELLREGQTQIGDRGVVIVHPDLDRTGDGVAPHLG